MLLSIIFVSQLILGAIFLKAGWSKLFSPSTTALHIQDYQLLTNGQAKLVAFLLPPLEVLIGLFYLTGFMLFANSVLATLLLCIFSMAIFFNLKRGRQFSCHCFGNTQTPIGLPMLLRNGLLVMLSVFLLFQAFFNPQLLHLLDWWPAEITLFTRADTLVFIVVGVAAISGIIALLDGISSLLYKI